ncbi:MAG TPA: hypothetical protein VGH46_06130 [Gaiellaceae bacterium]|jgi:hypothetical protein
MKCALLPASALVLVVTACGAGATSAPRVTEVGARVQSINLVAVRRKATALREATLLLHEFVPPPGARSIPKPRGYGGVLRQSGSGPLGETADAHEFWSVRRQLPAVAAFVRAHRPPGLRNSGATYGSNVPHYLMWSFSSQRRYLNVTAVALPGRTIVRLDAKVLWIYPRSQSERVPAATREIVVTSPKVSREVTDPATVARISRWFDALPISPPGIAIACPLALAQSIGISFRNAHGAWLAQAEAPPTSANICDTIAFQIDGHTEKPLIDSGVGDSFVRRLQQLLGVRLIQGQR